MATKTLEKPSPIITPEEIAARIAASTKKRPPIEKINNSQRLADSGLRIVHLLPSDCYNRKGMTIAYRPSDKPVMEISTALCKRGDVFSRKMGTKTAIENFEAGHTVFIPVEMRRSKRGEDDNVRFVVVPDPVNTIKGCFGA